MSSMKDDLDDMGGLVTIEVLRDGKNGPEVIHSHTVHNLIVNTGKRQTWRMTMSGLNTKKWNYMRIGSNSAAAASGDTNVKTAITGTLKTIDSVTLLSGTRTAQFVKSYPSGVGTKSGTIKEVCILNQLTSPGGSALMRAVFSTVTKTTADKLRITYRCRIT